MAGLLSIPSSNADSEGGCSILRKIHTDQRPTLSQLGTIKLSSEDCCHDETFSKELLMKYKKANSLSLNKSKDERLQSLHIHIFSHRHHFFVCGLQSVMDVVK